MYVLIHSAYILNTGFREIWKFRESQIINVSLDHLRLISVFLDNIKF